MQMHSHGASQAFAACHRTVIVVDYERFAENAIVSAEWQKSIGVNGTRDASVQFSASNRKRSNAISDITQATQFATLRAACLLRLFRIERNLKRN